MAHLEKETSDFYIDLDSILDTRLGVLSVHFPDMFPQVLEGYHFRRKETFPGIEKETFEELYARRSRVELSKSIKTGMLDMLLEFTCQTNLTRNNSPYYVFPKITLNTFPYLLPVKEEQQILNSIKALLHDTCDIEIINRDPMEITLEEVALKYSLIAMYSGAKWLDVQAPIANETRKAAPNVGMFIPGLVDDPTDPSFKDPNLFFKKINEYTSPLINLQCIPVQYFCYKIPST